MKIDFYNLQKINFEKGIIAVVQKAYDTKQPIFIKVANKEKKEVIDKLLWEYDPSSWLPHGTSKQEKQPIFISETISINEETTILIITDCSDIPFDEKYSRCLYIFNGNNTDNLQMARHQYKQALEKNLDLQYHNL